MLVRAAVTADPGEAVVEDAAPEVRFKLPLHEPREPWATLLPRRAGDEGVEMGLDGAIED